MPLWLDHVGLSVGDLDTACEFYSRAFGFARQLEFELAPHPIGGLMMRHESGMRLELFEREGSVPGVQGADADRGAGKFPTAGGHPPAAGSRRAVLLVSDCRRRDAQP
jgi:catechol 2,3-dioxygenase-like lactoylglutathione lyase family enzyme